MCNISTNLSLFPRYNCSTLCTTRGFSLIFLGLLFQNEGFHFKILVHSCYQVIGEGFHFGNCVKMTERGGLSEIAGENPVQDWPMNIIMIISYDYLQLAMKKL